MQRVAAVIDARHQAPGRGTRRTIVPPRTGAHATFRPRTNDEAVYLQQIYDETHQAKRLAHDFTCLKKSILKLGIMCTIAPNAIIQLIRSIQMHHPGVELQLCDGKASDLQDRLLGGGLEVAVYCVPGQEPDDRLHAMPLFREQIVIAMPDTHPASLGEAETCLAFILGISVPLSALLIVML